MKGKDCINIDDYIGLVKKIAAKYAKSGVPFDDLVQEGLIGLIEAQQRFDSSKNTSFSTYARFWIKKRVLQSIDKEYKETGGNVEYSDNIGAVNNSNQLSSDISEEQVEQCQIEIPAGFPDTEKTVLHLHFNKKQTLDMISDTMSISREKVRQLKQKALRRMRLYKPEK